MFRPIEAAAAVVERRVKTEQLRSFLYMRVYELCMSRKRSHKQKPNNFHLFYVRFVSFARFKFDIKKVTFISTRFFLVFKL